MAAATGRKQAPAKLRLLNGKSEGRDSGGRKVAPPPPFRRVPPAAPDWLDDIARDEWERVVPELARLELLKPVDGASLAAYCEMVSVFVRATREVHAGGIVLENRSTRKDGSESTWFTANPAVGVQRNAQAAMRAWAAEFGLTPAAEGKLSTGAKDAEEDDDPFGS